MKKLIYLFIFGFVFYAQTEAQTIIMSNTTTNACGGNIVNPGGFGGYPAGANVVTTICPSVPGQCVRLNFTAFDLDLFGDDQLVIYDGPTTASPIIGTFTSNGNPGSIQSSTQSANGCITLRFTSSAFPFIPGTGFQANISCVTCEDPPPPPPTSCANAAPFCTNIQGGITFPASTNIASEPGPDYDCLFTQPNPAWYFLEILDPGLLTIFMQSTPLVDIDFIVWGPFNSLDNVCVGQLTAANVVDCSYSAASTETATIPNALTGQFYLFLITNFSNQPTNINFSQTGGTGSTNCQIFCDITAATATPTACNNATNSYNLSGSVTFSNAPTTGTLTITNSNGGTQTVNAPFASPFNYAINNITANGGAENVSFAFSDAPNCTFTVNYTAPQPCSPNVCNVVAGSNSPVCTGQAINLTATPTAGATYAWTGPNGFSSTLQNPIINSSTLAMAGDYSVTITLANGCTANSTVSVTINQTPAAPTALSNSPICEGNTIDLTAENVAGAIYTWGGAGITPGIAALQNPSIANATVAMSGTYQVTVTLNGCISPAGTVEVGVFAIPTEPVISANANPICSGQDLELSITSPLLPSTGVTYTWTGPNGFTSSNATPTINDIQLNQAGNYAVFVDLGGCVSPIGNLAIAVSDAPAVDAGPDVQLCSSTPINIGSPGLPGVTYSWSPANFISDPNISNPTITPVNSTNNTVTLTYTLSATQNGCTSTDEVNVSATPIPVANFTVPPGQCFLNNSFGFVAAGDIPSTATFDWIFGPSASIASSTLRNPSGISFSSTGPQAVTLIVSNNDCVSLPFTANVEVFRMPVANFVADVYAGCDPLKVTFTNLSESPGGVLNFTWDFGNEKFSSQANPFLIYEEPGLFTVSLLATSPNGCSDRYTANDLIRIDPAPRSAFNTDPFGETTIVKPEIYLIDYSTNANQGMYIFSNGDIIEELNATYTFVDTGMYTITQIVSNEFGCSDTSSKLFRYEHGFKLYIPNTFTPNNDGKNDYFRVYGEDVIDFKMIIYSRWGQILYVTYDMDNGWDGKTGLSNKSIQQDTYIYHVEATNRLGEKVTHQGPLFLIK